MARQITKRMMFDALYEVMYEAYCQRSFPQDTKIEVLRNMIKELPIPYQDDLVEKVSQAMGHYGQMPYDLDKVKDLKVLVGGIIEQYHLTGGSIRCKFTCDATNNAPSSKLICSEFEWVDPCEDYRIHRMRSGDLEYMNGLGCG